MQTSHSASHSAFSVLDVGCGGTSGFSISQPLFKNFESDVRCDLLTPIFPELKQNFVKCDCEHLPFKDDSFNMVTLTDVLEHLSSPLKALKEIKRVARKLVLSTPNAMFFTRTMLTVWSREHKANPHYDHIQVWSKSELENLFRRAGITRFQVDFWNLKHRRNRWFARVVLCFIPFAGLRYGSLRAVALLR